MVGITQKAVWLYFHYSPSKNIFCFCFFGERAGADMNQQKHTQKNSKPKFDKSCQYYDNYIQQGIVSSHGERDPL